MSWWAAEQPGAGVWGDARQMREETDPDGHLSSSNTPFGWFIIVYRYVLALRL